MTVSSNLASKRPSPAAPAAPGQPEAHLAMATLAVVLVVSMATLAVLARTGGSITVAHIGLAVTVNGPR